MPFPHLWIFIRIVGRSLSWALSPAHSKLTLLCFVRPTRAAISCLLCDSPERRFEFATAPNPQANRILCFLKISWMTCLPISRNFGFNLVLMSCTVNKVIRNISTWGSQYLHAVPMQRAHQSSQLLCGGHAPAAIAPPVESHCLFGTGRQWKSAHSGCWLEQPAHYTVAVLHLKGQLHWWHSQEPAHFGRLLMLQHCAACLGLGLCQTLPVVDVTQFPSNASPGEAAEAASHQRGSSQSLRAGARQGT